MLSSRLRQILLVAPLVVALASLLTALGLLAAGSGPAGSRDSYLAAAILLALAALGMSVAQIVWHARAAASERSTKAAEIAEAQQALDTVSDGVIVYDNNWRFIFLNRVAALVAARPRSELIGLILWDAYPSLVGSELHQRYLESQREQRPVSFEYYSEPTAQWLELRLFPTATRITVVLRDVSLQHATLAKLEQANLGIAQELRRSEEIAASLRTSNKQLGERNRQLQEFAHIASHDLQEPLRKIRIFGEMLREQSLALGDTGADYLRRMLAATARMQTLIASLMAFARVGTSKPSEVQVDLNQLVVDVLADLVVDQSVPHPEVSVGRLPLLVGDPVLMRQVMQNLLGNAIKFVKPGERARIEISGETWRPADSSVDWCRILVRDHGIGFDPSESELIFDIFRRLHGRASYEGSGIGLAIVRRIVEHHGGHVRATASPGAGATFEIEMPTAPITAIEPDGPSTEHTA